MISLSLISFGTLSYIKSNDIGENLISRDLSIGVMIIGGIVLLTAVIGCIASYRSENKGNCTRCYTFMYEKYIISYIILQTFTIILEILFGLGCLQVTDKINIKCIFIRFSTYIC